MIDKAENPKNMDSDLGEIILYQSDDGRAALDVRLQGETVWLSQKQISSLFGTERSVITKHINNIFRTEELDVKAVCAKFAHTAADNKTYQTNYYNLDVILAVGYRVNAKRGTQFRIWATSVLKDHLVQGYTLNQRRLTGKGVAEMRQVLALLTGTLENHDLVSEMFRHSGSLMFKNLDFPLQSVAQVHPGGFGIIVGLNAGPKLNGIAEIAGQTEGGIGTDAAFFPANLVDPHHRNADVMGKPILTDIERLQEFLKKYFAGMHRRKVSHDNHLM